jgi:hypothetical protein
MGDWVLPSTLPRIQEINLVLIKSRNELRTTYTYLKEKQEVGEVDGFSDTLGSFIIIPSDGSYIMRLNIKEDRFHPPTSCYS